MAFLRQQIESREGMTSTPSSRPTFQSLRAAQRAQQQAPAPAPAPATFGGGGGGGGVRGFSRSVYRPTEQPVQPNPYANPTPQAAPPSYAPEPEEKRVNAFDPFKEFGNFYDDVVRNIDKKGGLLPKPGDSRNIPSLGGHQGIENPIINPIKRETVEADTRRQEEEARADARPQLGYSNAHIKVRPLTESEWQSLDPETQQMVVANFAAYQAGLADQQAGGTENTQRVINDFGFNVDGVSAQDFINGDALLTTSDILGRKTANVGARQQVGNAWAASQAFDEPGISALLQQGTNLIQAMQGGSTVLSSQTMANAGAQTATSQLRAILDENQLSDLYSVLQGLASRQVNDNLTTDAQLNDDLRRDLATTTQGLDPALVAGYFEENYPRQASPDILSYDEFRRTWLGE